MPLLSTSSRHQVHLLDRMVPLMPHLLTSWSSQELRIFPTVLTSNWNSTTTIWKLQILISIREKIEAWILQLYPVWALKGSPKLMTHPAHTLYKKVRRSATFVKGLSNKIQDLMDRSLKEQSHQHLEGLQCSASVAKKTFSTPIVSCNLTWMHLRRLWTQIGLTKTRSSINFRWASTETTSAKAQQSLVIRIKLWPGANSQRRSERQ